MTRVDGEGSRTHIMEKKRPEEHASEDIERGKEEEEEEEEEEQEDEEAEEEAEEEEDERQRREGR